MTWMLKNSKGKPDAMLTMGAAALIVVLLRVGLANLTIAGIAFGPGPDSGTILALLGSTLGSYVARRNGILATTEDKPLAKKTPPLEELPG